MERIKREHREITHRERTPRSPPITKHPRPLKEPADTALQETSQSLGCEETVRRGSRDVPSGPASGHATRTPHCAPTPGQNPPSGCKPGSLFIRFVALVNSTRQHAIGPRKGMAEHVRDVVGVQVGRGSHYSSWVVPFWSDARAVETWGVSRQGDGVRGEGPGS